VSALDKEAQCPLCRVVGEANGWRRDELEVGVAVFAKSLGHVSCFAFFCSPISRKATLATFEERP